MSLPGTVAGTVGRFEADGVEFESWADEYGDRCLDVDGTQAELGTGAGTVTGRAATRIDDTRPLVTVRGTEIDLGSEEVTRRVGTEWAARGRVVSAESTVEEGGGFWPFTLLSAVSNVRCERLNFDTDAVREAWADDGTLSETWLAGSRDEDDGTVMAYGGASTDEPADIGLGFERAWEGYMLRGVVYATGYVSCYEDLGPAGFLRFVTEELVPHGYVPEDDEPGEQSTL